MNDTSLPKNHIRSDRFDNLTDSYGLTAKLNSQSFTIENLSDTGAKLLGDSSSMTENSLLPIKVFSKEHYLLFSCTARVVWKNANDSVGIEFTDHVLPREFLHSLDTLLATEFKLEEELSEFESIPEDFRRLVSTIENFLVHLKHYIDDLENKYERKYGTRSIEAKQSLLNAIDVRFGDYVASFLLEHSEALYKYLDKLQDKNQQNRLFDFFRREINQYYLLSPYGQRAFEKPLSYAGDYEMMNQIYREGFEGASLFAKIIHRYGIKNEPAAVAVREQKFYLADKIKQMIQNTSKDTLVFCSIACGPAQEWVEVLKNTILPENISIQLVLIDQNIESLLEARRNIRLAMHETGQSIDLRCEQVSVRDILEEKPTADAFLKHNFDFIYTVGLYDYLPQPVAQMLTHVMHSRLNPQGGIIISNFHPACITRALCEFSTDRNLTYRTEEELKLLSNGLKNVSVTMKSDIRGHIVYMHLFK